MRRKLLALASMIVVPAAVYACSDDEKATSPAGDAATATETSTGAEGGAQEAAAQDTSKPPQGVIAGGCTQADFDKAAGAGGGDFTGMPGVEITFPTNGAPQQYTNRCAKVKVGAKVTFTGKFTSHPLSPKDGDKPTPVVSQSDDTDAGSISFTVPAKGTFGYECTVHPDTMFGAIQVVP